MATQVLRKMLAASAVVSICAGTIIAGTLSSNAACEPPPGTPVFGPKDPAGGTWKCPTFNDLQGGAKQAYFTKKGAGGYYATGHNTIYTYGR